MRKRKDDVRDSAEDKVLDVNATMQGTLRFDDPVNLRISGNFEGTLDTKGNLMIGNKASIKANITGESISVAGKVAGNIRATKVLKLESTARLVGDIETPRVSIAEGAVLNGQLRMGSGSSSSKATDDLMTISQLAKYLEVDENKINEWAKTQMLPGTRNGEDWMFERTKIDQWIAEGKVKV